MGWLDDLKKKGQQAAQQAQSAVQQGTQAANQAYNTGKQVVQQVKQNAPGVVSTVQNGIQKGIQKANDVANTTKNMVQNVKNGVENAIATGKEMYNVGKAGYEGAVSGIKDYYAGDSNTQAPPQETDWAAEYDKVMQGDGQGTIAPTQSNTPTSSTPATNPDGTVTVTQPNGQPINTSPAANAALGAGAGQWQSELDGIMNQIMNREKFSFDMNGDAMYQQYADMYQNQANLGMQNAMAQAAALTGGYGSSYGQMVGQQAYAQQMQGLNDVALDLYDRAYNQYQDEGNQLAQQYAMIADREQQAYNRDYQAGRDAVADEQWEKEFGWQAEQFDKLYGEEGYYNTAREDEQAYNTSERVATQDYQSSESEKDRTHDKNMQDDDQAHDKEMAEQDHDWQAEEFNKMYGYTDENGVYHEGVVDREREDEQAHDKEIQSSDQAHDKEMATEEREWQDKDREDRQTHDSDMAEQDHDWQAETWDKMYGEDGYYTKQNKQAQDNWQAEFDREGEWYDDAKEANNPNTTYEGDGTLKGESVPKQLAGVPGLTTTNTGLFDDNGYFKTAAVVSGTNAEGDLNDGTPEVGKGTMTYNIGGKEVTLKTGTSPYTNSVNPDAKNGVMENGYQPDNYGGYELEEEGTTDVINGVRTPVYQIKDSNPPVKLIWDDASNQYISYGDQELPDPNDITINSNDVASPPKNPVDKPQFNGPAEPPQETLIEDEIPPEWKEEISEKLYTAEEAGTITNPTLPTGSESPEQVVEKMIGMGWKDVSNAPYSQATRDQLIAEGKMVAVDVNGEIKYLMR